MNQKDEYGVGRTDRQGITDDTLRVSEGVPEADARVTEIREGIEHTRADMSETLDALQERLGPSHLKDQVREQIAEQYEQVKQTVRDATIGKVENMVERVSDKVYQTRGAIVETIQANPIPSALVGIGLAWLWMNGRGNSAGGNARYGDRYGSGPRDEESSRRYGGGSGFGQQGRDQSWDRGANFTTSGANRTTDAMRGVAGQVQEAASNLAGQAKEAVSGMVDQAQEKAGHLVDQAQFQARRVEDRFNTTMRESPLAVGAVALALGTAVGLVLPQTRKENEWMGEARDTVVDKAQSLAHDTIEHVQQAAQKVSAEMSSTGSGSSKAGQQSGTI